MPTATLYAVNNATRGWLSHSSSYASARAGTDFLVAIDKSDVRYGQVNEGSGDDAFQVYQPKEEFDLASIPVGAQVLDVDLKINFHFGGVSNPDSYRVAEDTVGDFISGASLPSGGVATLSGPYSAGIFTFTEVGDAFKDLIEANAGGILSLSFNSERHRLNTSPVDFFEFNAYVGSSVNPSLVIIYNQVPSIPTDLLVTSNEQDTTPNFSVNISDPDSSQDIKARFEVRTSADVLVGTIDSSFRTGAGSVIAEYSSGLSVGSYKVRAKTIDDLGGESGWTSYVTFDINTIVTKDLTMIWDVEGPIIMTKDLTMIWDVAGIVTKDLILKWNVEAIYPVIKDLTLVWNVEPNWVEVPTDESVWVEA